VVDLAWLLAGSGLARVMRKPAWSRAINILFALALLASVAVGFL
jgi:threonine/homoserine/homoserine lactone efflux protein